MKFFIIFALVWLFAAWARADCPASGVDMASTSTAENPVEVVVECPCINWGGSSGNVSHYHAYEDGTEKGNPTEPALVWCLPEMDTTVSLIVIAYSPLLDTPASPVSNPLFVRWVALDDSILCTETEVVCTTEVPAQCLDPSGTVVVPCP